MRSSLWCICAAILFALTGCDDFPVGHVLVIHCDDDTGFDDNNLCRKPNRPGAELAFRVNEGTQKVIITIVKDDGTWGLRYMPLDRCTVVDDQNWECSDPGTTMSRLHGMVHGRYYHSLTGYPPDYYTSSISGLTFLKLYYGFIRMSDALIATGYSAQAVNEARLRCAAWSNEDWCQPCYRQGACRHSPTR
jgi:hypothetical protein